MRLRATLLTLFALLLLLLLLLPSFAQDEPRRETLAELQLLADFNAWRIDESLWPLRRNPILDQLAALQAQYVLTWSGIPTGEAVHHGRQNEGPRVRALWAPYSWPSYGRPDRVSLEEITYVGRNIDAALDFWAKSTVHRHASLNSSYREFGVAVYPHRLGHLFVMVLAGRPGVLPVMAEPDENLLYLSNETFWGADGGTWIQQATEVRLLDARGSALGDWQPWQPTLPIPETNDDTLYVELTDGRAKSLSVVRIREAAEWVLLPNTLPTSTPLAPTGVPTAGPSPTPVQQVQLIYNPQSFTLLNISSDNLNLSGLAFTDGQHTMPAERWDGRFQSSSSIYFFPPGGCLQAWPQGASGTPPKPLQCGVRHAWVDLRQSEVFWTESTFQVTWFGLVLAECPARVGQCGFYFP